MSLNAITGILSSLGGLTGTALNSTAGAIMSFMNTTKSQTKSALNAVLQVSSDAKASDDAITKLSEVPGLQSSIQNLIPAMRAAAGNPVVLGQLVATAQTELNS